MPLPTRSTENPTISIADLIRSRASDTCPTCEKEKKKSAALCSRCLIHLPIDMSNALTLPFSQGYEEAMVDAVKHLGGNFTAPRSAEEELADLRRRVERADLDISDEALDRRLCTVTIEGGVDEDGDESFNVSVVFGGEGVEGVQLVESIQRLMRAGVGLIQSARKLGRTAGLSEAQINTLWQYANGREDDGDDEDQDEDEDRDNREEEGARS